MKNVSIIIVNYNTFDLTAKCIASVMEYTQGVSYEIILVDNASTETKPHDFLTRFPNIQLIESDVNLGFAKGNNLGLTHAKGEVILLLNSDTELTNDAVSQAYRTLIANPSYGVVTGNLIYPDGKTQHNCQAFPSVVKAFVERTRLHKLLSKMQKSTYLQGFYFDYTQPGNPDWVWGTFFMFRKSLLNEFDHHKLPETYFMYMEDMEWCMEIRKKGYTTHYNPSISVIHHLGGSGGNTNQLIRTHFVDFIDRYYTPISAFLLKKLTRY